MSATAPIPIIRSVREAQQRAWSTRQNDQTLGFVPTMGALHEGHASLINRSAQALDHTVVSVFVNPAQFGPNEDFANYPRRLEADAELARQAGADWVFAPHPQEVYPPDAELSLKLEHLGKLGDGASRPVFFDGITLVVTKLLNAVLPSHAFFGLKDFQQWFILRKLAKELLLPVDIVGCPLIREPDGLAMSSRNEYLTPAQRPIALTLPGLLADIAADPMAFTPATAHALAQERFAAKPGLTLDYLHIRNARTFAPAASLAPDEAPIVLVAGWLEGIRLIDNQFVYPEHEAECTSFTPTDPLTRPAHSPA